MLDVDAPWFASRQGEAEAVKMVKRESVGTWCIMVEHVLKILHNDLSRYIMVQDMIEWFVNVCHGILYHAIKKGTFTKNQ